MANKWVLNTTSAPLFFLLSQLFVAIILFLGAHAVGLIQIPLSISVEVAKGLVPMVGLSTIGLSLSNYTLKYVDASFYQVARGLVLPFTVGTSFVFLHSRPSLPILSACGVVTLGFFVGVFLDAVPLSVVGVSLGVLSSCITAIHSVVIKKALDVVGGSALHLSWYTNLLSVVVLVPLLVIMGELPKISKLLFEEGVEGAFGTFMWGSLITGVIGFLMSIASLLSIKVTSPITHMVSSAVRGVASALLGMWLFNDVLSTGRWSSIAIILGGSLYYTWVKHVESQNATAKGPYERGPMEDIEGGKKTPDRVD
ncbi:hypothetical protein HWV62_25772 [Athelia sp. TMB]|nr:hypothetical protein HWV62_25772 [Athelia sp. TMB]